ncbi:MAG: hypothetical protein ACI9YM_001929 [Brevundimonas sp.]|jgi:hypothetical protein|uniref:AAA family ATPase n=1 Tax=Brevundimonas sp. TaxID=1871086 RepID=UPI0039E5B69E
MADRVGLHHPLEINALRGLTTHTGDSDRKGEIPSLANLPTDLLELLGPTDPPPETRNAAPAGPRNGVAIGQEAAKPRAELYDIFSDLLGPVSPLDQPLTWTRFTGAGSRTADRRTASLRDLAGLIKSTTAAEKSRLPWLKLASFGDVATDKGALRHDANLIAVHGIEGDYDAGQVSVGDAVARLNAAGLAALVYTTPSHTADVPRWRVLCPTSADIAPGDREALCERLNGALGGILAPESFTRSQAYYFGGVGTLPEIRLVDGRTIDLATELPRIGRYAEPARGPETIALDDDDDDLASLLEPDWTRIDSALATIAADDREDWRTVGMALHAESMGSESGFAAWDTWSQVSEKYDARDQRRVWASFGKRGGRAVTIGTLFHLAAANGWNAKAPANDAAPSRLTFLSPSECESSPARGYVVKGFLAPGDIGCIFGAPGAGKSLIGPHLGYAVARGVPAFGMRTKPGKVFYVAAEDPHGMRGRVTALKLTHGDAPDFTLVEGVSDLLLPDSPDLAALLEVVEARRPALIFLDTLAMSFPGLEENSAQDMGKVVAVARSLTQFGAAVVLIHHDTKAEGSTPRGHSLLNGALDMALLISRDETGVTGKLTKNRNGGCERRVAFSIDPVVIGEDEDGDIVTAACASELDAPTGPYRLKLSPSEQAALTELRMHEGGHPDMSGQSAGVSESEWRAACVDGRAVSAAEEAESRKKAFRRAFTGLVGKGYVRLVGDRVHECGLFEAMASGSGGFDDLD